ncbi:monocarboxylate transporter 13 [Pungitius pungitius]|uniref:monocarboxylate transporter 13 n=1 Tax=Pungitius pungitius TaxID=134920 RepID=UPI002E136644
MASRAPPDGGYGWVVVTSAFFVMGLTAAVLKNFGLFFLDIQSHFGVLTSTTSWVTSTTIVTFHLGAPLASALTMQFSHRLVIVVGGLLSASGLLLASLDLGLPWLYLTMGVLEGTGIAFAWIPANSLVSHYFSRWRPIAYAVASSGECVFAVVFGPLFRWLIEAYGWQGALLVIGGLQLNLCVCGALMRPLGDGGARGAKVVFQFSLLAKPELLLYILYGVLAAAGFFVPPLFLVPFVSGLGAGSYRPAFLLSALALADLAGRLLCGWLANARLVRNLRLLAAAVALLGAALLLLPVSRDYRTALLLSSLCGFLFGCAVAVHVTAIVDIVALEGFDSGLGLFMLFRSIGGFVGPPAAGWLVDRTGDYSAAFYLSGVCLVASAGFVALVDRLVQRRSSEAKGHQAVT